MPKKPPAKKKKSVKKPKSVSKPSPSLAAKFAKYQKQKQSPDKKQASPSKESPKPVSKEPKRHWWQRKETPKKENPKKEITEKSSKQVKKDQTSPVKEPSKSHWWQSKPKEQPEKPTSEKKESEKPSDLKSKELAAKFAKYQKQKESSDAKKETKPDTESEQDKEPKRHWWQKKEKSPEKVSEKVSPESTKEPLKKEISKDQKTSSKEKQSTKKEDNKQEKSLKEKVQESDSQTTFTPRSPFVVFGLFVCTLGIYALIWLYKIGNELKQKTHLVPPFWMVFFPIFNLIYLYKFCKAVQYVTSLNRWMTFMLFFFFFPVSMGLIQNSLNSLGASNDNKKQSKKQESVDVDKELEKRSELSKKKKKKETLTQKQRLARLKEYMLKAGFEFHPGAMVKKVILFLVIGHLFATLYMLFLFSAGGGFHWSDLFKAMALIWVVSFSVLFILFWIVFFFVVDLIIYNRKKEIEEVLPDFLQLTASNIKAGMTIDRALWYAVRPRFGILAKEIELVAKETMAGEELQTALLKFTKRYDSPLTSRAIALLIEGMDSGGEIGDLLTKIANNLETQKLMVTEMAASVTTYVIFISFASIVAAPGLFALSGTLVQVLQQIAGSVDLPAGQSSMISISGDGISIDDFKLFAMVSLTISSSLSAMLISVIKKGNVKAGIKNIPVFILISLGLYYLASLITDQLVSVFI